MNIISVHYWIVLNLFGKSINDIKILIISSLELTICSRIEGVK